jgi:hypothetical protein
MLAADGCASSSSKPACCFCGVWIPAGRESGGRHVRTLTGLGMLICRNDGVQPSHTYALTWMSPTIAMTVSNLAIGVLRLA